MLVINKLHKLIPTTVYKIKKTKKAVWEHDWNMLFLQIKSNCGCAAFSYIEAFSETVQ